MRKKKGKGRRKPGDKTVATPCPPFPLSSPPLPPFINNAEHGAPRCCEVFVNGRANCNKQEWCLSPLTGTTLLIRLPWPDGTLGGKTKKDEERGLREEEEKGGQTAGGEGDGQREDV